MNKKVTLHTTNGQLLSFIVTHKTYRALYTSFQKCLYDNQGMLREQPVGTIEVYNEESDVMVSIHASQILPVMEIQTV